MWGEQRRSETETDWRPQDLRGKEREGGKRGGGRVRRKNRRR
jgi:hypothetical protein